MVNPGVDSNFKTLNNRK